MKQRAVDVPLPCESHRACVCGHLFEEHDCDVMGVAHGCATRLDVQNQGDRWICSCQRYRESAVGPQYIGLREYEGL